MSNSLATLAFMFVLVQSQAPAQLSSSLSDSLTGVERGATAIRRIARSVDIGRLGVSYDAGKVLEMRQNTLLQVIEQALDGVSVLRRQGTSLERLLALTINVEMISVGIEGLTGELAYGAPNSRAGAEWNKELSEEYAAMGPANRAFRAAALQHMSDADERLRQCGR